MQILEPSALFDRDRFEPRQNGCVPLSFLPVLKPGFVCFHPGCPFITASQAVKETYHRARFQIEMGMKLSAAPRADQNAWKSAGYHQKFQTALLQQWDLQGCLTWSVREDPSHATGSRHSRESSLESEAKAEAEAEAEEKEKDESYYAALRQTIDNGDLEEAKLFIEPLTPRKAFNAWWNRLQIREFLNIPDRSFYFRLSACATPIIGSPYIIGDL